MTGERTYLDYNATAPLRPEAYEAVRAAMDGIGNASSVHKEGRDARALVENARQEIATLVGVAADCVTFTSGGTEANHLAFRQASERGATSIFYSAVEHPSVAEAAKLAGAEAAIPVSEIPVDENGSVSPATLSELLKSGGDHPFVSVMAANNETGVLQPLKQIAELVHDHGGTLHTDAVQMVGKAPFELKESGADMATLSAHKIGGPLGIGAFVLAEDTHIAARQTGGGQERGRRSGTENVSGIAGFGAAASVVRDLDEAKEMRVLRDRLETSLKASVPDVEFFGGRVERLSNTSCLAAPGLKAETLLMQLDLAGLAVSAGSACSSGKVARSHVLDGMGVDEELAGGAVRVSLGWKTTEKDIEKFCAAWIKAVQMIEAVDEAVGKYKYGFSTDIESEKAPKGLNEDTVRFISAKKNEPEWLLEWRLDAFRRWQTMEEPDWAKVNYPKIDYQDAYYYAAPKSDDDRPKSLDEVDPKLLETYEKLGIPLVEQMALAGVAVDAVFDSVSVATTFKERLAEAGVIFCSFSEAVQDHPELVRKYLGTVVPVTDNYFATLNSAVFSDGSFVYVPKGVRCPMELSTYFRINEADTGQFERTLIVVEDGAYVSYLEGCTAPMRDEHQLHAAVVELVCLEDAEIKYSTVQNWYPGDEDGNGGIYNFVTKRGDCRGDNSKISWTQVETGSAVTWKYPSCVLRGDNSVGEFYSIAISNNLQQVDSGTKMIHLGKNTSSRIISKGISAGRSSSTYRGLVSVHKKAEDARNFTQCDSLLIGDRCSAHTVPYIESKNPSAVLEHEATTSKLSEDQLFYCRQRGLDEEEAVALLVNGFCRDVLQQLPMEFAVEAQKLVGISLEGSVG
eukprot:s1_g1723.t1